MSNLPVRLLFALAALVSIAGSALADQARAVPDTPASFALPDDRRWVVLAERQDGEAAIGLARSLAGEYPTSQVARTSDGRYAVVAGPEPVLSAEQLKEKFEDPRGLTNVRQVRGDELVARAWQSGAPLATATMSEGKPAAASTGALTIALRVAERRRGKEDKDFFVVAEGREGGKVLFSVRSEALYSPEPHAKVSWVALGGPTPQAVVSHYTGGAHCCMRTRIATRDASGKWQVVNAGALDGEYGPTFEDLDGDGSEEILSADNRFLYAFDSYADSAMPGKIEKLIGGRIVDVSRRPEYRRFHVQSLAVLEGRADADDWKRSGFLAGWVAQKILLGEGAEAWDRMRKSFDPGTGAPFEECNIDRPVDKCPESRRRKISFEDALRKFLDKNGYR